MIEEKRHTYKNDIASSTLKSQMLTKCSNITNSYYGTRKTDKFV